MKSKEQKFLFVGGTYNGARLQVDPNQTPDLLLVPKGTHPITDWNQCNPPVQKYERYFAVAVTSSSTTQTWYEAEGITREHAIKLFIEHYHPDYALLKKELEQAKKLADDLNWKLVNCQGTNEGLIARLKKAESDLDELRCVPMTDDFDEPIDNREEAESLAAQCWTDPETSHLEMDTDLASAIAKRLAVWMDLAAIQSRNRDKFLIALRRLMPFVLEDYHENCCTKEFREAVAAAKQALKLEDNDDQ